MDDGKEVDESVIRKGKERERQRMIQNLRKVTDLLDEGGQLMIEDAAPAGA